MRLGQLARKLMVRPAEIVEFLATKDIQIEDGTNTKIETDHAILALQHFSPTTQIEDIPEDINVTDIPSINAGEDANPPQEDLNIHSVTTSEATAESNDVIKAPKIELSGLRVLGKIDLPEPKKKVPEVPQESAVSNPSNELKRERRTQDLKGKQRYTKNPIALRREQEALEAKKKREEEIKLQKEKRTQNYLKKVKSHQPTKAAKFIKEKTVEMSAAELEEPPKTLWGKLIKWLTT